jgi:hypothetical protein
MVLFRGGLGSVIFEEDNRIQAKDIPTIATRPATIPQYPYDIGHTLA